MQYESPFHVIMLLCINKLKIAKTHAYLTKTNNPKQKQKKWKLPNSMLAASEIYLFKGHEEGFI